MAAKHRGGRQVKKTEKRPLAKRKTKKSKAGKKKA